MGQKIFSGTYWNLRRFVSPVNRSSLSKPEDALFDEHGRYNGLCVVGFSVSEIPPQVDQPQGPAYAFFMHHDPQPDNYRHSEIWSDQIPGTGVYKEPSKSMKLFFRIRLCQQISRENIQIAAVRSRAPR